MAVKRLKVWSNKAEVELSVEVEILARVRHKNLLSLRGYCAEGQERLIVYDYMPNLSLLSHLHGQHSVGCLLDWTRRMNIAIGSAEGIAQVYLHHHSTPHIIHRDIKASNVLPDSDFTPQRVVMYTALAFFLLEVANGKKPLKKLSSTLKRSIAEWALPLACEGQFSEVADPRLNGKHGEEELKRVVLVALVCADPRLNGKYVEV
ncbi:hypothetical protein PTKIN_Ptkin18bG0040400 [Pterospermum kingtungense]